MAKLLASAAVALTALAAVADIASFCIANGGIVTRAVFGMAGGARSAAPATASARCSQTAVVPVDPECALIADPERRAACLRNPPRRVEICVNP
jgi:nickel-dependent lactate racemase